MILSIIIPVYNEERTAEELLRKVSRINLSNDAQKEIIVINDGSTDNTPKILERLKNELGFVLLDMGKNQGKGAATREGIKAAKGDYTVIQDADLEYDPQDLDKLLQAAVSKSLPVIYGSRRLIKENLQYSALSFYVGGVFLSWLTNLLYWQNITDEPTCYKMFKTDLLKSLPLACQRFEFCPEVTALVAKRGIKIPEVPIKYYPRHVNEGKKINWKDGVEAGAVLIKLRFKKNLLKKTEYTRGGGLFDNLLANLRSRAADKRIRPEHRLGRILDIGSGSYPNFLVKTDFKEKFGLDKLNAPEKYVDGVKLANFDFESQTSLPFPENYFDTVTMLAVFEHIDPPKLPALLGEIRRVLKPNGQLIVTTPTIWTDASLKYLAAIKLVSREEIEEHKAAYTPKQVSDHLAEIGFNAQKIKTRYFELGMNIIATALKD